MDCHKQTTSHLFTCTRREAGLNGRSRRYCYHSVGPWGCSGCTLGVYKYLYKVAFEYPLVAPSSGVALVRHPKTTRLCVSVA